MQQDVYYNSDLEKQLLHSLTVREEREGDRRASKRNVRFDESTHHKERASRKHQRDSQRSRESPGLPGSRRHNRHQNKMQLLDKALSDSESELEIEVELVVSFKSPFKVLFEDAECRRRWEPFVEITEEQEKQLLRSCYPSKDDEPARKSKKRAFPTDPAECFKQLRREEKQIMKRQTGNPLLEEIEKTLMNFLLSRKVRLLFMFSREERFQRILFNCCCVYYSLHVEAYWLEDGSISETVRKPKGVQIPSGRLSAYLKTLPAQQ